jgi:uncharacterized protein (TIGR00661 family)
MARIVYGVSGEGSGHSSRARVVLRHLVERGHEVKVATYDRGLRNLAADFDVIEVEGLHIASDDNRVSKVETFVENLRRLPEGFQRLRQLRREAFESFAPDVVFTDFEPMTAYLALHHDLPLVTIDNQHRMRYMRCPRPDHLKADARVTETVIRAIVPRPDVSLITTFWFGELLNQRSFLFGPILRREVLALEPSEGEHVLVYLTKGFDALLETLRTLPAERFRVYGTGREGEDGNLAFRPFSHEGFLGDLASARAVVSTAGFTLMTEALHLGKPMLALPMRGQFEQELNALMLEDTGSGRNGREATRDTVAAFLYDLPRYREALARYPRGDNSAILTKVDELLAHGCALARELHARRKAE